MLSIGIVGSDNSHALAYSSLLNLEQAGGDDARATCIWGMDETRTAEVAEKALIPEIVSNPEEMFDRVDAVFVEDRHGGLHAEHAIPFLERGIPVFVDKPLATTLEDCGRILAATRAGDTFVTSFSSLRTCASTDDLARRVEGIGEVRYAQFAGPCDFESINGGAYFYATHTVEIALRLIGEEVRSVSAVRSESMAAMNVVWESGVLGTLGYLGDAEYHFSASLFGTGGMVNGEVLANHDGYRVALGIVLEGLRTGIRPYSNAEMVRPIAMIHAMERSLAEGGEVVQIAPLIDEALDFTAGI